jgi:hypothetical protein
MKPRPVAILLAVLLGGLGIAGAIAWWRWTARPRRPEAPLLTPLQAKALATFEKRCTRLADCEEPLTCVYDFWQNKHLCLASECRTDADCPTGLACRAVPSKGPDVLLCFIEGDLDEGERCKRAPRRRATACARGLICNEYCGRPCELDDETGCPEHSVCMQGLNGPSCVPSCRNKSCPPGTECIRIEGEMSVCTRPSGTNCQKTPCPDEQSCQVDFGDLPEAVRMWCATECRDTGSCPTGSICFDGTCRRECSPEVKDACPDGYVCAWFPTEKIGVCAVAGR